MPSANSGTALASARLGARPLERRRHQRVKVNVLGRYMRSDRQEFPCQTIDMSPGGVALFAPVKGFIGERIIVYLDHLGRIEGPVVRHLESGFALSLNVPLLKREKLAEQLTWLANRHVLGLPEERQHERIVPRNTQSSLTLADGREYVVRIIDISLTGVAMHCDVQPPIGSLVTIGTTRAQVLRHFQGGIVLEFTRPIAASAFDENVTI